MSMNVFHTLAFRVNLETINSRIQNQHKKQKRINDENPGLEALERDQKKIFIEKESNSCAFLAIETIRRKSTFIRDKHCLLKIIKRSADLEWIAICLCRLNINYGYTISNSSCKEPPMNRLKPYLSSISLKISSESDKK